MHRGGRLYGKEITIAITNRNHYHLCFYVMWNPGDTQLPPLEDDCHARAAAGAALAVNP